ncbi:hypothetical protein [Thauera sp. WH-1]
MADARYEVGSMGRFAGLNLTEMQTGHVDTERQPGASSWMDTRVFVD